LGKNIGGGALNNDNNEGGRGLLKPLESRKIEGEWRSEVETKAKSYFNLRL